MRQSGENGYHLMGKVLDTLVSYSGERWLSLIAYAVCLMSLGSFAYAAPKATVPAKPAASSPAAPAVTRNVTLNITFPAAGDYYVRIPSAPPYHCLDQSTTLTLTSKPKVIYVDDAQDGNVAEVPFPANGQLVLHATDFSYVRKVIIDVTWSEQPVKAALVGLVSASYSKQTDMTPSDNGSVSFDDVPAGKAELTITYGQNLTDRKDLLISTDHPAGPVKFEAALSNKTDVLSTPAATSATPSNNTPQPPGPTGSIPQPLPKPKVDNPAGELINFIVGLIVVGAAVYLLYRWSRSGGMGAYLKKLGLDTNVGSGASNASFANQTNIPPPPVTDPTLCPYCGQKKDAMGNCACSLAGGGASPASAVGNQPRLVASGGAYAGNIYPLNNSHVTIGRETTNAISLSNDNTVSRRHASIEQTGADFTVRDEGSSNGVYVNGVKINGVQSIRPGDEIQIGNTRFRFEG